MWKVRQISGLSIKGSGKRVIVAAIVLFCFIVAITEIISVII